MLHTIAPITALAIPHVPYVRAEFVPLATPFRNLPTQPMQERAKSPKAHAGLPFLPKIGCPQFYSTVRLSLEPPPVWVLRPSNLLLLMPIGPKGG